MTRIFCYSVSAAEVFFTSRVIAIQLRSNSLNIVKHVFGYSNIAREQFEPNCAKPERNLSTVSHKSVGIKGFSGLKQIELHELYYYSICRLAGVSRYQYAWS